MQMFPISLILHLAVVNIYVLVVTTQPSPNFSPGFGILGQAGKAGWLIPCRGIAVAMAQEGSAKMQGQIGPKTK